MCKGSSRLIGVVAVAGILMAPVGAAAQHHQCAKMQDTCPRPSSDAGECSMLGGNPEQPAVVDARLLPRNDAAAVLPVRDGELHIHAALWRGQPPRRESPGVVTLLTALRI